MTTDKDEQSKTRENPFSFGRVTMTNRQNIFRFCKQFCER